MGISDTLYANLNFVIGFELCAREVWGKKTTGKVQESSRRNVNITQRRPTEVNRFINRDKLRFLSLQKKGIY